MCEYNDHNHADDDRNILKIPEWNMAKLDDAIEKLNRRGAKIGCAPVTYEVLETVMVEDPRRKNADPDNMLGMLEIPVPKYAIKYVEIKGEGPKIEGWKFLGTFDHNSIPGSVIVKTVPGETIPKEFHNCEPICDHCGKKRIRNETFLLQEDETGDYKLVGRQCIRDFIGYDTRYIFTYLTYLNKLGQEFVEDEENGWDFGGGQRFCTVESNQVLRATAAVIRKYGWTPKSKSDEFNPPTASYVVDVFNPPKSSSEEYNDWKTYVEGLELDDPRWANEAKEARAWLAEQDDSNEYMHNLHVLNGADEIPFHMFGFWCSLVSSYQRAMDRLRESAKQKRTNDWVGEVKKRQEFTVKLLDVRAFDGAYGYTYMHKFVDDGGHTLIWWASSDSDMEKGERYVIVGTVKKHDEYNDWKQTLINRVKVKEHLEPKVEK